MSDDKSKRGTADRSRIDVNEEYECRYWSEKFGVSPGRLKKTVKEVGPNVDAVAAALGKAAWMSWAKQHG